MMTGEWAEAEWRASKVGWFEEGLQVADADSAVLPVLRAPFDELSAECDSLTIDVEQEKLLCKPCGC